VSRDERSEIALAPQPRPFARLHMVQSAMSSTSKALEHALEVVLFDLVRRPLLTDAGECCSHRRAGCWNWRPAAREEVCTELAGELQVGCLTTTPVDLPAC
jgi:hypothetical protein